MHSGKTNIFVVGTRAQLIKVAPVIFECEQKGMDCALLMTGQHKETMEDLLSEFSIRTPPVYAVNAAERSTILSLLLWLPKAYRGILKEIERIKKEKKADKANVIVHGDTLTTLLSAYCARRSGDIVVHVESGLSSGKLFSPFPEELVRRLVFKVTELAFCPDEQSARHMQAISPAEVINTHGNTIFDSLGLISGKLEHRERSTDRYVVVSIHRFDNIYSRERLTSIVELLKKIAATFNVKFVLHPATIKRLKIYGLYEVLARHTNVELINRLGYSEFIRLAYGASCVLTDGGSNQEELAFLGVPTIVMRKHTERNDGLGSNALMESQAGDIADFLATERYRNLRKDRKTRGNNTPSALISSRLSN